MIRKTYNKLIQWKYSKSRFPLIIRGARQVGKTYILKQFGQSEFDRYYCFDFERTSAKLGPIFDRDLTSKQIIANLSIFIGEHIYSNSLIIFDEIQNCPQALSSLKYFAEEAPLQAVCATISLPIGKLNNNSTPIRNVTSMNLYPMSFEEFLINTNQKKLYQALDEPEVFKHALHFHHRKLLKALNHYYMVGGMPKSILAYSNYSDNLTQAFAEVRKAQQELLDTYHRDFNKYAGTVNAVHISSVFENIPQQLSNHGDGSVQRFRFNGVIPGKKRFSELQNQIKWLCDSGLVYKTQICTHAASPLKAFTKHNIFKLYLCDVGLLGCMLELSPKALVLQNYGQIKGFFAENFVACELIASGDRSLYSWSRRKSRIEFLKEWNGDIIPIEVKSELRIKAKSLHNYIKEYDPNWAVKISANPINTINNTVNKSVNSTVNSTVNNTIKNAPFYCLGRLNNILI